MAANPILAKVSELSRRSCARLRGISSDELPRRHREVIGEVVAIIGPAGTAADVLLYRSTGRSALRNNGV